MTAHLQITPDHHQIPTKNRQKLLIAKQFLDKHCPLEFGSHADVSSYVVYYNHLMAFFTDGQHCGLESSKQFVALCGHRESPSIVLLRKDDGAHIELSFNTEGETGRYDKAHLNDVQYETPFSSIDTQQGRETKLWMSFIDGVQHTQLAEYAYRGKRGEDYRI